MTQRNQSGISAPLLGCSNVDGSFGLFIRQATEEEINESGGYLLIEDIAPASSAALCIMIQPGDRLLTLDREPVDWLQPEEVFNLLSSMSFCTLELGRLPIPPYPVDPGLSAACYAIDNPATTLPRLPSVFHAEMPPVITNVREIDPVVEESDDRQTSWIAEAVTDGGPMVMERCLKRSDSICSDANSVMIRDAVEKAERATGFQVRQIYLPTALPKLSLGLRLTKGSGIGGTIVVSVRSGSPACQAGLLIGDRILGLDNQLLLTHGLQSAPDQLLERIEGLWRSRALTSPSDPVCLTVISASSKPLNGDVSSERHFPNEQQEFDRLFLPPKFASGSIDIAQSSCPSKSSHDNKPPTEHSLHSSSDILPSEPYSELDAKLLDALHFPDNPNNRNSEMNRIQSLHNNGSIGMECSR